MAQLASFGVLERGLKDRIGAHTERVLQGQVSSERGQSFPQSTHAFRTIYGGAAVDNTLVGGGPIELQSGFDNVNGL